MIDPTALYTVEEAAAEAAGSRPCPDCEGLGFFWEQIQIGRHGDDTWRRSPCPRCGGTGEVET
jgi:DnaJ-class molecular chaperone